jgi:hypothetical protein
LAFDPIPLASHAPAAVERPPTTARRSQIAWIAVIALPLAAGWAFLRLQALPFTNVIPPAWNFVGRDPGSQQLTGFVALGLALISSLRPRRRGMAGRRELWRMLHVGFGLVICVALLVHTSARLGRGLNLVLSIAMLALLAWGAVLGLVWRRVPPQPSIVGRGLRPLHLWFWWPALGLIAVHVLAVYYF